MAKCIIFQRPDGGMSVIRPVGGAPVESQVKFVPKGADYDIVDEKDLPNDRVFRDAWRKNGKNVETDLTAAKSLAHGWRRNKREQEFAPLDKEINIHISNRVKVGQVEAQRQAVRDKYDSIQTEIDRCGSEGDLRGVLSAHEIAG